MTETRAAGTVRHDWTLDEINALFALPLPDLMLQAQTAHRAHFDARDVQLSTLLSIKTGACPEARKRDGERSKRQFRS